jgi:argininosuccinate synthase
VIIEDLRENFVTEFMYPMIQADCIYEDRYLLGTCELKAFKFVQELQLFESFSIELCPESLN